MDYDLHMDGLPAAAVIDAIDAARIHVESAFAGTADAEHALAAARTLLERALTFEPESIPLLTCLGAVACDQGDHAGARAPLAHALVLGSTDRHTAFNMGVAVLNSGDMISARMHFSRARGQLPGALTWEAYFDPHGH